MKRKQSKIILGSAIGLAALAVAIDHSRHTLPQPETQQYENIDSVYDDQENPCSLDDNPCSLEDSGSPCSLDDSTAPCGLD